MKTVEGRFDYQLYVECPGCNELLNVLHEKDMSGDAHDDDNALTQPLLTNKNWDDIEVDKMKCYRCGEVFNMKGVDY